MKNQIKDYACSFKSIWRKRNQLKICLIGLLSCFCFLESEWANAHPNDPIKSSIDKNTTIIGNYTLPFKAEDLKPGERIYTGDHAAGTQEKGEDFGLKYYTGNKKWSYKKKGTDGTKNAHFRIYGKPIYAIADGTIIGCWCNAPENPRPKKSTDTDTKKQWLHSKYKGRQIPGGGNMLKVEHSDGTIALYAHMIPGSMKRSLCANKAALYPQPLKQGEAEDKYARLPANKRVKIKKGQFLGKVGNSGNSTGPHLHLHLVKNGQAATMRFERGLYKKYVSNNTGINGWKSFAGKSIPDGKVLIWPARTVTKEYTRHGFKAQNFQRLFKHLADSGYELEWIDGYSVANKAYLNFSWQPAKGKKWKAFFGLKAADYQKKFTNNSSLAPVFVDTYTLNGQVRYNLILKAVTGKYLARHGLSYAQHEKIMEQAKKENLEPINISVASVNNQLKYTVLYRNKNYGSWYIKSQVKEADYQKVYGDFKDKGMSPCYINAYKHKGATYFTTVFAKNHNGALKARHGMSSAQLQTAWKSAVSSGYDTKTITAFDGASSQHRFAALWRK